MCVACDCDCSFSEQLNNLIIDLHLPLPNNNISTPSNGVYAALTAQ